MLINLSKQVKKDKNNGREVEEIEIPVSFTLDLISNNQKIFVCLFFFNHFRATLTAYGGSQARDPFRAVAAGLCH